MISRQHNAIKNSATIKSAIMKTAVAALMLLVAAPLFATSIEGMRLWRAPDHTRLVFDLSDQVEHNIFTLDSPHRLVIDVTGASPDDGLPVLELGDTPIADIRSAPRNGGDYRIVLDLKQAVNPRSFALRASGQYGDRLVVDLYDKDASQERTVKDMTTWEKGERDIIIAIDPGHGGEDPGAIGPNRIFEKNVVMAISQELKRLADSEQGFRAELVRTGDYYIPLRRRTDIARQQRADLFVSIHADAFKNPAAHGASVFALSAGGATSETAKYLAERENRADLIGGAGSVRLSDKDSMLAGVLLDLSMTATLNSSLEVGEEVLKSMGSVARLHKKQVEQAGFMVLKSPDIPSILVETGFISNPAEARQLASADYRRRMAEAIFDGIRRYFHTRPPVGTWVAANAHTGDEKTYVIGRGDTLSDIAQQHNISVERLRRHNGLSSTVIRVGQRIKIPTS